MARIRLLHLADLHLGWSPPFTVPRGGERRQERDALLTKAVDYALSPDSGIRAVIIAGDLFETHRPASALADQVIRDLRRLVEAGIPVVTVPGNHDEITYHDSVYRQRGTEWPGLLVKNPLPDLAGTFETAGVPCHIYSLAYTGGLTRPEMLGEMPRHNATGLHIAVFHGSLDWPAGDRSLPLSSQALASAGYDYVALGHIHRHQTRMVGPTYAVYPGSVEAKGFSDPGEGFFTVAEVGDGPATVHRIPAGTRVCRTMDLDVSGLESETGLVERIRDLAGGHRDEMLQIRLTGVPLFPPDLDRIGERVADVFFHAELADASTFLDPQRLAGLADEPTIRGCFVRRMNDRINAASNDQERRIAGLALLKGLAVLTGGEG